MSLELKIEALTAVLVALTAAVSKTSTVSAAPVVQPAPLVAPTPTAHVVAPVVAAPPAPATVSPSNVMPAPPGFMAPAPTVSSPVPFSDTKGLIEYVMKAYTAMGPQKGAQIQGVLTSLGYQNINDVKPEHYAQLHTGVEVLKGQS